jgi:hypothetical protein
MAKRFFQSFYGGNFGTSVSTGRVNILAVYDGVVYGGNSRPCNYYYSTYSSPYYYWNFITPDGTTKTPRFQIGEAGGVSWNNKNGQRIFSVEDNSPLLSIIPSNYEIEGTTITGRRRFNDAITKLYQGNYLRDIRSNMNASFPVNFTCEGITYIGVSFPSTAWGTTPASKSIIMYRNDDTYAEYTLTEFSTNFRNKIIDFGEFPQEVAKVFTDWLDEQSSIIYPNSYTVKSFNGEDVLVSVEEKPAIKQALLTVIGNMKTLTLTGVNDVAYVLEWNSVTPEGTQFVGLSFSPNSKRFNLPIGIITDVSWLGDLILYEAYGIYRPPATTFDINLYQNSAEVNRVDKGQFLVGVGTLSGALREECSMLTPSIVYQSSDVPTFNYVYIPIFNRYYYVTSLSSVSKNVWRMELNCDVLMTYKEQIFLLQGVIGRQEIDFNPLLVDNELPTQNNPIVEVIDIPSDAFNTQTSDAGHNYVITVIG